jgi:hypothetical protein
MRCIILLTLIFYFNSFFAQDLIVLKNNDTIYADVKKVNEYRIYYELVKKNNDTIELTKSLNRIQFIILDTGEKVVLKSSNDNELKLIQQKNSIQLELFSLMLLGEIDISYEILLKKSKNVGIGFNYMYNFYQPKVNNYFIGNVKSGIEDYKKIWSIGFYINSYHVLNKNSRFIFGFQLDIGEINSLLRKTVYKSPDFYGYYGGYNQGKIDYTYLIEDNVFFEEFTLKIGYEYNFSKRVYLTNNLNINYFFDTEGVIYYDPKIIETKLGLRF